MRKLSKKSLKVIDLDITEIDDVSIFKIKQEILALKDVNIALNLEKVNTCTNSFFEMFKACKNNKISLVNVNSIILSMLYMTGYDKFVRVYEDVFSLFDDKNELIKRRFKIV